jgi:hypothetical protein
MRRTPRIPTTQTSDKPPEPPSPHGLPETTFQPMETIVTDIIMTRSIREYENTLEAIRSVIKDVYRSANKERVHWDGCHTLHVECLADTVADLLGGNRG